jgi:DNA-binding CsgD family transcriptional regulator
LGATSVSGVWPLVGRDEELRLIIESLRGNTQSGGVAIIGPAGVGKTRLAREAAAIAAETGAAVRWTAGTQSAQTIPLGAFSQWAPIGDGSALHVVSAVIDALTTPEDGGYALVAVDDAQLLDDLSAFVLHQLVIRKAAPVVITIRSGEPVPDAVTALWKDGYLQLLELQPLSREESDVLLRGALAGDVDPIGARRMWELTGGNVLYLRHLVAAEVAAHHLVNSAGVWAWTGTPTVSPTLVDLIETQVGSIPQAVLEAVDLVAVAEPLESRLVASLVDPSVIEDAERRGLITVAPTGKGAVARVAHPLYGEVRRSRAGPSRLRRLRGRIASALATSAEVDDSDIVRLGLLWLDSDLRPDPDVLFSAARAAFVRFDLTLAERLAAASAQAGDHVDAALLRAQALGLLNRADESQAVLASLHDRPLDDCQRAYQVVLEASNLWTPMGRPDDSWHVIETALESSNAVVRQSLQAQRVSQLAMLGRPSDAIALAEHVDRHYIGDFEALMMTAGLTTALGDLGRISGVEAVVMEGYERAARSAQAAYLGVGLAECHVRALLLAGSIVDAVAAAHAMYQQCGDAPGIIGAMGQAIAATAALGRGRVDEASRQLSSASAVFASLGAGSGLCYRFSVIKAEALARLGDAAGATAVLAGLEPYRHPGLIYLEPDRLLALAWAAAARGAVTHAIAHARQAAQFAHDHGQLAREVMSLQVATHFGDKTTAHRLGKLCALVEGPRARAAAEFAAGLVAGDGDALHGASQRFEAMDDIFAAADTSSHAATAYRNSDRRGSALTAVGRAQRLARQCGGAISPALREATEPLPLTPREREVITLVAQGMSNRQIANEMRMSIRTVEGHLYRAAQRSGTTNRNELAALIREFAREA